ncbi:phospholipase A2, variant [Capsaspora owczarzaki ATCC 30864]|uniref:Phospholipase A2, variant n=1 Tax=Capsaspora owczarzaki (strain ATCC 30864) TaxID=595528 RepID=A0A0D2UHA1_CAPO3|nr:phospholipase A2, variant [Capsaspora owczarzaki ATCC 30864]
MTFELETENPGRHTHMDELSLQLNLWHDTLYTFPLSLVIEFKHEHCETGAIDHWPALERWTDAYLVDKLKDNPVTVAVTPNGYADAILKEDLFVMPEERTMTFAAFLKLLEDNKGKVSFDKNKMDVDAEIAYVSKQNGNLTSEFSSLLDDVTPDLPFATEALGMKPDAANIWIGDAQSVTSLHKDHYENLYAVVAGSKTFTIYPPTDVPYLYYRECKCCRYVPVRDSAADNRVVRWDIVPEPKQTSDDEPSSSSAPTEAAGDSSTPAPAPQTTGAADAEADSFENCPTIPWIPVDPLLVNQHRHVQEFPLFCYHATPLRCTIRRGDVLYLPAMWYHHVQQSESYIETPVANPANSDELPPTPQVFDAKRVIAVNFWYDMDFGQQFAYFQFLEKCVATLPPPLVFDDGGDDHSFGGDGSDQESDIGPDDIDYSYREPESDDDEAASSSQQQQA